MLLQLNTRAGEAMANVSCRDEEYITQPKNVMFQLQWKEAAQGDSKQTFIDEEEGLSDKRKLRKTFVPSI